MELKSRWPPSSGRASSWRVWRAEGGSAGEGTMRAASGLKTGARGTGKTRQHQRSRQQENERDKLLREEGKKRREIKKKRKKGGRPLLIRISVTLQQRPVPFPHSPFCPPAFPIPSFCIRSFILSHSNCAITHHDTSTSPLPPLPLHLSSR